jgi:hypothetical protein
MVLPYLMNVLAGIPSSGVRVPTPLPQKVRDLSQIVERDSSTADCTGQMGAHDVVALNS